MLVKHIIKKVNGLLHPFNEITDLFYSSTMYTLSRQSHSYENAIDALNRLQSNPQYLRNYRALSQHDEFTNNIIKMRNFMERSGLHIDKIENSLSIIHITGTKGKGSTCAYCETILQHHGFRTGFYLSPHMVEVRERIKINGLSLDKSKFAQYFWDVYNKLQETNKDHLMPIYFQMLTIVAFRAFIEEKVDVAIVEVGIGGEYDSTNFLSKSDIVGITSLGIDHTTLLGNTLEQIAWHKAGIMKQGAKAFTVPQPKEAMAVLQQRSLEKKCSLKVVNLKDYAVIEKNLRMPYDIFSLNATLGLAISEAWLKLKDKKVYNSLINAALQTYYWPGRYQIFHTSQVNYYIDGAHTIESISLCVKWFIESTSKSQNSKVLVFNLTGERDPKPFFSILRDCDFDTVIFVPNVTKCITNKPDSINYNNPVSQQLIRCATYRNIWKKLDNGNSSNHICQSLLVMPTVTDVLDHLHRDRRKLDVLITGSLHLVGSLLSIIDPELRGKEHIDDMKKIEFQK